MDGTFATFQGYPLFDVNFTRSRGFDPDTTLVTLLASSFPEGFSFDAPAPGDLARPRASGGTRARPGDGAFGPAPAAKRLAYEGQLYLAERVGGELWAVTIGPLFVTRVQTVMKPDEGDLCKILVTCVDARFHWDHGWLRRWSFNRVRGDGTVAADSVKPGLVPFTLSEVGARVLAALFRSPKLAASPADWTTKTGAVEFEPNSRPRDALARLVSEHALEAPCLRLDNTVALHKAGDGFVGYAPNGVGPNVSAFPGQVRLYRNGAGQSHMAEFTYVEDVVLVAGGLRVATVAMDDCEPVIMNRGRVYPLVEKTVRQLTAQKHGMEWLARFVLQPNAYQSDPDVDPEALSLLAAQAWRAYRPAGIEKKVAADDGDTVREPGPNAHLPPLLDRAETSAGKRLPVTVECYGFTTVHHQLDGTQRRENNAVAIEIQREINVIRNRSLPRGRASIREQTFIDAADVLPKGLSDVSLEELQQAVAQARYAQAITDSPSGVTDGPQYAKLYKQLLELREANGQAAPGSAKTFELAQEIVETEAKLRKKGDAGGGDLGALADRLFGADVAEEFKKGKAGEALRAKAKAILEKIDAQRRQEREDTVTRERAGLPDESEAPGMIFLRNQPRTIDAGARVIDARQGVFMCSDLAGHVEVDPLQDAEAAAKRLAPTNSSHARFVPAPVRVIFGSVMRPRTDVPQGTQQRVQTGPAAPAPAGGLGAFGNFTPPKDPPRTGGETYVPKVLTDEETYYLAAFKRVAGNTAQPIPLDHVPDDQVFVVPIDQGELVPMEGQGDGNRAALDAQAEALAVAQFKRPPVVKTSSHVLARPWSVNCDGLVQSVSITMRFTDGAPCGFNTTVVTGSTGLAAAPLGTRTRLRRAQGEAATREGTRP